MNKISLVLMTSCFMLWCREPEIELTPPISQPMILLDLSDLEIPKYREMDAIVTAYCPCNICCEKWAIYKKTFTGNNSFSTGCAVDKKVIKLGSLLLIPGYGFCNADDIGGKIKGNRIDVRFKTHKEAVGWGIKKIKVRIYEGNMK